MDSSAKSDQPRLLRPDTRAALVLTCEHASHDVPARLGDLGLHDDHLRDHIGWDLGAAWVTEELSDRLEAPAVLSAVSRLIIDCNRAPDSSELIPERSHGIEIPANRNLDEAERRRRIGAYYRPFHDEVDRALEQSTNARLLSIHSFTPDYDGRDFDVGVLFDSHESHAEQLASDLRGQGFRVRMNEPYSGYEGLIFSAQLHGRRFDREYLELEINNRLIRDAKTAASIAERIAASLDAFVARA